MLSNQQDKSNYICLYKVRVEAYYAFFTIHNLSWWLTPKGTKSMIFIVKNVLTSAIIVVNAKGRIDALNKGRKVFNEPNRNPQPVTIVR